MMPDTPIIMMPIILMPIQIFITEEEHRDAGPIFFRHLARAAVRPNVGESEKSL